MAGWFLSMQEDSLAEEGACLIYLCPSSFTIPVVWFTASTLGHASNRFSCSWPAYQLALTHFGEVKFHLGEVLDANILDLTEA